MSRTRAVFSKPRIFLVGISVLLPADLGPQSLTYGKHGKTNKHFMTDAISDTAKFSLSSSSTSAGVGKAAILNKPLLQGPKSLGPAAQTRWRTTVFFPASHRSAW